MEDTDQARSTPESEAAVLEDLKWIGIKWDEGNTRHTHSADCHYIILLQTPSCQLAFRVVQYGACIAGPDIGGPHGPYRQSERKELYQKYVNKLVDDGLVYPCFCTDEELTEMKADAEKKNLPPIYRCYLHTQALYMPGSA